MRFHPAAHTIALLGALLCFESFLSCGGGSTTQSGGEGGPRLTQIVLTPANPTITKGLSQQFTATGSYDDGTQRTLSSGVTWQTSQSAVASINAAGSVTGAGQGVAQISATYEGVRGATSVTVAAAALISIAITPSQSSLPIGESEQLTASGQFSDGTTQDLTQSVAWVSLGSAIASVGPTGDAIGNAVGTATISASFGSVTGTANLTVTPAAVVSLNVNPATVSVGLGSSRQFHAIATLSDGSTQDLTGVVAWSSSQPEIAGVSSGGLAVAEQVGSTSILAQNSGLTGSADLSVLPLIAVNYFDRASAEKAGADGNVRITNPGLTSGSICAMVYVFDQNQALNECCGCTVSDSGLRSFSLLLDLTANPLTGKKPSAGVIKVVPSDIAQNPICDPSSLAPTGVLLGWGNNVQILPDGNFQATETKFEMSPLSDGETSNLTGECAFIKQAGSGAGTCSCGTGD